MAWAGAGLLCGLSGCAEEPRITRTELEIAHRGIPRAFAPGIEPARAHGQATSAYRPAPLGERRLEVEGQATRSARMALGRTAALLGARAGEDALRERGFQLQPSTVRDRDAVELVLLGKVDFAVTTNRPSRRDRQAGLLGTLLGAEVFVMAVSAQSPLREVSARQARRIVAGQLTDWSELGRDLQPLVLLLPAERERADRIARAFAPGDPPSTQARRVTDDRAAFDELLRDPSAIAVVRMASLVTAPDVRALAIDRVGPSMRSLQSGHYPFGTPLMLVTPGQVRDAAAAYAEHVRRSDDALPGELSRPQ